MIYKSLIFSVSFLLLAYSNIVLADGLHGSKDSWVKTIKDPTKSIGDESYIDEAQALIKHLETKHKIDRKWLEGIFKSLKKNNKVIKLMSSAPERKIFWGKYSKIFLNKKRINMGKDFLKSHAEELKTAHKKYGVPKNIITAILGVETYYGNVQGHHSVVESLATLAFDYPRRSKFFLSELKNLLIIANKHNLPVMELKGSYAGAMGHPQFMPSSFTSYAVDFDGSGNINIWEDSLDAIGSIANYLSRHGWVKGLPVAYRVYPKNIAAFEKLAKNKLKPSFDAKVITSSTGVVTADKPTVNNKYAAFVLKGKGSKEYWLGTKNFYVISRYNPSYLYSMAVYQLSELIK